MDDVLTAMRIADEFRIRLIISHGTEASRIAPQLASKGIPVILGPMASNERRIETAGARPDSAAVLVKAGVRIGVQRGIGGSPDELLAQARSAVVSGLSYDEAIKALTIWPAGILGASNVIGSIEIGKKADIVVFSSDPLKELARVELVVIDGRRVEFE
jgi:imidazolonepropionase-like amidohydrolase